MELNSLKPAPGSNRNNRRRGRGVATGSGGTAGRGHKGHKSRSGHKAKRGHEGGQMPLQMRLPKFGFRNPARTEYVVFNLDQLQNYSEKHAISDFDPAWLLKNGMISKGDLVKILGRGEIKSKINFTAHACSATAKKMIEEKGGTITIL